MYAKFYDDYKNMVYAKLEKCSFDLNQVEFLGYIVSSEGISMDPTKMQTILEWNTTICVWCLVFLGICDFLKQIHQELLKEGSAS